MAEYGLIYGSSTGPEKINTTIGYGENSDMLKCVKISGVGGMQNILLYL